LLYLNYRCGEGYPAHALTVDTRTPLSFDPPDPPYDLQDTFTRSSHLGGSEHATRCLSPSLPNRVFTCPARMCTQKELKVQSQQSLLGSSIFCLLPLKVCSLFIHSLSDPFIPFLPKKNTCTAHTRSYARTRNNRSPELVFEHGLNLPSLRLIIDVRHDTTHDTTV
jgi:hypothetical protein